MSTVFTSGFFKMSEMDLEDHNQNPHFDHYCCCRSILYCMFASPVLPACAQESTIVYKDGNVINRAVNVVKHN